MSKKFNEPVVTVPETKIDNFRLAYNFYKDKSIDLVRGPKKGRVVLPPTMIKIHFKALNKAGKVMLHEKEITDYYVTGSKDTFAKATAYAPPYSPHQDEIKIKVSMVANASEEERDSSLLELMKVVEEDLEKTGCNFLILKVLTNTGVVISRALQTKLGYQADHNNSEMMKNKESWSRRL